MHFLLLVADAITIEDVSLLLQASKTVNDSILLAFRVTGFVF